jgi:hypothetical protein
MLRVVPFLPRQLRETPHARYAIQMMGKFVRFVSIAYREI